VEEQGLVAPGVARGQVVAVVVEYARARAVGRPLVVLAAGRGLLAIGRVGADLERGLRDGREIAADDEADPPVDVAEGVAHRRGGRRLEARVGAQEIGEAVEVALEADRVLDLLHLAVDAVDLAEAELVDLLGSHGRRGVGLDQVAVERRPARHRP
jgi:hypothetical protein